MTYLKRAELQSPRRIFEAPLKRDHPTLSTDTINLRSMLKRSPDEGNRLFEVFGAQAAFNGERESDILRLRPIKPKSASHSLKVWRRVDAGQTRAPVREPEPQT